MVLREQQHKVIMELKVEELLQQLAQETLQAMKKRNCENPIIIGIYTGGVWIAEQLHRMLKVQTPLSYLNVNFYRDDFSRGGGIQTHGRPSAIKTNIDDQHIILVDDVLQTGRTIRAALNEVFDYGRPQSVLLSILVARKQKELPICADAIGTELDLKPEQTIKLTGPQPLQLKVR